MFESNNELLTRDFVELDTEIVADMLAIKECWVNVPNKQKNLRSRLAWEYLIALGYHPTSSNNNVHIQVQHFNLRIDLWPTTQRMIITDINTNEKETIQFTTNIATKLLQLTTNQ